MHALGEEDRQRRLDARDAAPRLPDIALALLLGGGRAGRVIGADRVHASREHLCPEGVARRCVADRWCAFERRSDALEVLLTEREVMWARLGRYRRALAARLVHLGQSFGTADMDHVGADTLPRAAHAREQSPDRI